MDVITLTKEQVHTAAQKAAVVLRKGGIILYPTDTVYGLGCDATNEKALSLIQKIKGREDHKPMSVIVRDVDMAQQYATFNETSLQTAKTHLPGPLTLILPATHFLSERITPENTIGIRIPNEPFCLELSRAFEKPYTTTSANVAGQKTYSDIESILKQFAEHAEHIDLVIDAGPQKNQLPSTIISYVNAPKVIREGAISKEEISL